MKFAVNRLDFINALEPAVKATSGKEMAILGNVLLTAESGKVKLCGYNLSVTVFTSVSAAIDEQGAVCIDGQAIAAFLQKCSETNVIADTADKKINIKCGKAKTSLLYAKAEDYPPIEPMPDTAATVTLETDELFGAVKTAGYAAADASPRKVLECINISIDKSGIKLISCDGYRAAVYSKKSDGGIAADKSFGIFKNDIKTVMSIISSAEITLKFTEKHLEFDGGGVSVRTNLSAERYPEIEKQVKKNIEAACQHVTVDSAKLKETLAKIAALPRVSGDVPLRIDISSDKISFLYNFGNGIFTDEMDCRLEGDPFTVGVKTAFLSEMLKAVRGSVTLNCSGAGGAITVSQEDVSQMIMPMRLRK